MGWTQRRVARVERGRLADRCAGRGDKGGGETHNDRAPTAEPAGARVPDEEVAARAGTTTQWATPAANARLDGAFARAAGVAAAGDTIPGHDPLSFVKLRHELSAALITLAATNDARRSARSVTASSRGPGGAGINFQSEPRSGSTSWAALTLGDSAGVPGGGRVSQRTWRRVSGSVRPRIWMPRTIELALPLREAHDICVIVYLEQSRVIAYLELSRSLPRGKPFHV